MIRDFPLSHWRPAAKPVAQTENFTFSLVQYLLHIAAEQLLAVRKLHLLQ